MLFSEASSSNSGTGNSGNAGGGTIASSLGHMNTDIPDVEAVLAARAKAKAVSENLNEEAVSTEKQALQNLAGNS